METPMRHAWLCPYENHAPFNRLLSSPSCNVALSTSLLGIGITITTLSIHNYSSANIIFLIGPILMTAGVLGLARSMLQYLKKLHGRICDSETRSHGNSTRQRHCRLQRRNAMRAQRQESETAIYLGPTDSEDGHYADDPPPYDAVAHICGGRSQAVPRGSLRSLPPYDEGLTNPALTLSMETLPPPPPYELAAESPPEYTRAVGLDNAQGDVTPRLLGDDARRDENCNVTMGTAMTEPVCSRTRGGYQVTSELLPSRLQAVDSNSNQSHADDHQGSLLPSRDSPRRPLYLSRSRDCEDSEGECPSVVVIADPPPDADHPTAEQEDQGRGDGDEEQASCPPTPSPCNTHPSPLPEFEKRSHFTAHVMQSPTHQDHLKVASEGGS